MSEERTDREALTSEQIERAIYLARGEKVMLDADLATLYGVTTKALKQAVRRNRERFPEDFMFELTLEEFRALRSQFVTLKESDSQRGQHPKFRPFAFTEQGVAMLSSVLRSARAAEVNIEIIRTFVRLRRLLATHEDLARKLEELESRYDHQFQVVFDAIRALMEPPATPRRRVGFTEPEER
ncbi:MAG: ORF6N domain-containing protein [Acidobacteriota bacterium]